MSWPSTDFELAIQQELDALRKVADAARAYVESDDEDRVREFDAMVAALKELKP